jgi:uncharacterized protein YoxC
MEENPMPERKQDVIDRKGAWLERMFDRLFGAIQKDTKGTIMILSIALNFYVVNLYLDTVASSKDEMIAEVRSSVKRETAKQLAPVQARQDSISNNVDSMGKKVDTSITSVKGIVQSVQQYIDKKQK